MGFAGFPRFSRRRTSKRLRWRLPFFILTREFLVGEPLPDDLPHGHVKAVAISDRDFLAAAIVESEFLLIQVTEQVKRLTLT